MTYVKNINYYPVVVHGCAWIVYASFIYMANYLANPKVLLLQTVLFLCPYCLSFYTSIYVLSLRKHKGVLWSVSSFFIVFLVMALVGYCYMYLLLPGMGIQLYSTGHFRDFVKAALLGYVQYFSYAMLYFYVKESFAKERTLRRMEEEKLRKELENAVLKQNELKAEQEKLLLEYAFLRSQVNPHFLHNTLNVLFSQALEFSQELADNIAKLSRIMRYSLESVEYENDKVYVEQELDNLQLLIDINNLRFSGTNIIEYSIEGEAAGQMVPPLSLITVVENAFKYGDLKDARHPLMIRIRLEPRIVYFCCRNKKRKLKPALSSHNIGINNLSKRLDVAFAGKYLLNVTEEEDFYLFELTIKN